jgi:hypothetical protein
MPDREKNAEIEYVVLTKFRFCTSIMEASMDV